MLFIKQCNSLNAILPELFQQTNDYTELLMNVSLRIRMVLCIDWYTIFRKMISTGKEGQVEIIGWLYQYYNTEKDETFALLKKNVKITKERIPAATQLFTPDWIVRYMVENSLGRLWLEGHPNDELKAKWKYYLDEAEQEPEGRCNWTGFGKSTRTSSWKILRLLIHAAVAIFWYTLLMYLCRFMRAMDTASVMRQEYY